MKHFARRLTARGHLDRGRFPFRSGVQTRHSATVRTPESSTHTPFRKTWKIPLPFRHKTPVIPHIPPNSTSNFSAISPAVPPNGVFQSSARLQSTFLPQVLEITSLNPQTEETTPSRRPALSLFPPPPIRVNSRPFAVSPSHFSTVSPAVPPTGFFQSSARVQSTFPTQVLEITGLNPQSRETTPSRRPAFSPFRSPPIRVNSRPFAVSPSYRLDVTTSLLTTATQQVCAMKHFARRLTARGRLDRSSFPFRSGVQTRRKRRADTVQTQSQTHQNPRKTRINTHKHR
jgi:hypothetical protein